MSGFNPLDDPGCRSMSPFVEDFAEADGENGWNVPEQLMDVQDPIAILGLCEEVDEEEGRAPGTTLRMYLYEIKQTY